MIHRESHLPKAVREEFRKQCDVCGKMIRAEYVGKHRKTHLPKDARKISKAM